MSTLFEDTKTAFALKSDAELERAYFLFKMIQNQTSDVFETSDV